MSTRPENQEKPSSFPGSHLQPAQERDVSSACISVTPGHGRGGSLFVEFPSHPDVLLWNPWILHPDVTLSPEHPEVGAGCENTSVLHPSQAAVLSIHCLQAWGGAWEDQLTFQVLGRVFSRRHRIQHPLSLPLILRFDVSLTKGR